MIEIYSELLTLLVYSFKRHFAGFGIILNDFIIKPFIINIAKHMLHPLKEDTIAHSMTP